MSSRNNESFFRGFVVNPQRIFRNSGGIPGTPCSILDKGKAVNSHLNSLQIHRDKPALDSWFTIEEKLTHFGLDRGGT